MKKASFVIGLLLFLSPAMHAMETAISDPSDDAGACSAYKHPLHDLFPEIIKHANVEDFDAIRLTCRLFRGELDRYTQESKQRIESIKKVIPTDYSFRSFLEDSIGGMAKCEIQSDQSLLNLKTHAYEVLKYIKDKHAKVFAMTKESISMMAEPTNQSFGRRVLYNYLRYIINITADEKKELLVYLERCEKNARYNEKYSEKGWQEERKIIEDTLSIEQLKEITSSIEVLPESHNQKK